MNQTSIDYLDYSWSPLAMRCTRVSPACDHCWHLRMAKRKAGNPQLSDLERQASAGLIPPVLIPHRLDEPLRLKKPQRLGVQFMGDLFHADVADLDIYRIFAVMARAQRHTFICLTKRPERMLDFCRRLRFIRTEELAHLTEPGVSYDPTGPVSDPRPLPNVWLGVTVENQECFDRRWAFLKQVPAAKILISHEPALGALVLPPDFLARGQDAWYIGGGETGPGARPSHPDWFRGPIGQCAEAGVPAFFKSWGEFLPFESYEETAKSVPIYREKFIKVCWPSGVSGSAVLGNTREAWNRGCRWFLKFGKRAGGRLLDGREWNEVPHV